MVDQLYYMKVLDKELEERGLNFVRYADDFVIYLKSKKAAERVMKSITNFITEKLKLKVNEEKSAVSPFTYLNRLLLKRQLPGVVQPALEGRRDRDGNIYFGSRTGKPTKASKVQ